jgi:hypothetical protein
MDAEQVFLCIVGIVLLACFIQLAPAVILLLVIKNLGEVFERIHEENAAAVE